MKANVLQTTERLACLLAVGVIAAFSLGSCNNEPEETKAEVIFPATKTLSVQPGSTETLSFSINADWILSSDASWATFDGEISCSGKAGDVEVELTVSDPENLEEPAHLTLTANDKEQIIYNITYADGAEYGLAVKKTTDGITYTDVRVYDSCPVELTITDGSFDVDSIISEYMVDTLKIIDIGYIIYEQGDTFVTTVTPLDTEASWIPEYFAAYDNWNSSNLRYSDNSDEDDLDPVIFTGDDSYPEGGVNYPSVDFECLEPVPDRIGFYYIVYRTSFSDSTTVALLFICPEEREPVEETSAFGVINGVTYEPIEVETGCPEGLDVTDVIEQYSPVACGYLPYAAGINYVTTVLPLDAEAWWITDATVYDPQGNNLYDVYPFEIEPGQDYYYNNKAYPSLSIYLNADPGLRYFYALYTNENEENFILFFYNLSHEINEGPESEFSLTLNGTETEYESSYSGIYDVSGILSSYSPSNVGYYKYAFDEDADNSYTIAPLPLSASPAWKWDAYDYDGNQLTKKSDFFSLNKGTDAEGNTVLSSYLKSDPTTLFYTVFTEDGENSLFFFYTDNKPEYTSFALKDVDTYVISYAGTDAPVTYEDAMSAIIEEYGASNVGYLSYELNKDYLISIVPYTVGSWVKDNFKAYDSEGKAISSGSTYSISLGNDYAYNGENWASVSLKVLQEPDVDFFYIVLTDDFGTASILFFYNEPEEVTDDDTEYDGFLIVDNYYKLSWNYTTEYSGEGYDFESIIAKYNATNVAYAQYEVGTTYAISPAPGNVDAEWAWKAVSYDYAGKECAGQSYWTVETGKNTYSDGYLYPGYYITVNSDPGTPFYVVFDKGYKNNSILFFTDRLVRTDSKDYDPEASFLVQDCRNLSYYEVGAGEDFSTQYDAYSELATKLANRYDGADIGFVNYPYYSNITFLVAPLPLSNEAGWELVTVYDGDGVEIGTDTTLYGTVINNYCEWDSEAGYDGYPGTTIHMFGMPGEPIYAVFKNSAEEYKIIILTDAGSISNEG